MQISFVYPEGKKKVLTFSYDDGNDCDRRLVKIFTDHKMKATFNLNSGYQDQEWKIHLNELKDLFIAHGHEVACHGLLHPFENQMPLESIIEDIREDRRLLEQACGVPIKGMAYPFGTTSAEVKAALRALGIVYCRAVSPVRKISYFPQDWLEWQPTSHHKDNIMELGNTLLNYRWGVQMLYIWGHAFEFENNNNWNIIEEFCDAMAEKDTIWYATNMEIYEYIQACKNLIVSVDGHIVKNPSALPVWFTANDTLYKIDGGQMMEIK